MANTINFSLAIYFVLLLYYSLPVRPVIQLLILQEVLINIKYNSVESGQSMKAVFFYLVNNVEGSFQKNFNSHQKGL